MAGRASPSGKAASAEAGAARRRAGLVCGRIGSTPARIQRDELGRIDGKGKVAGC